MGGAVISVFFQLLIWRFSFWPPSRIEPSDVTGHSRAVVPWERRLGHRPWPPRKRCGTDGQVIFRRRRRDSSRRHHAPPPPSSLRRDLPPEFFNTDHRMRIMVGTLVLNNHPSGISVEDLRYELRADEDDDSVDRAIGVMTNDGLLRR